jgi:hypothetical protein
MAATVQNSQSVMQMALSLAASALVSDHRSLAELLASEEFLYRLDSPEEYLAPPRRLRLARVMRTLMDNPAPSACQILEALTKEGGFLEMEQREFLLIQALVVIRPASPTAVLFWDRNSQSDSPYLTVTIFALADNGTPPALQLLETKMADAEIESDLKISWMRRPILIHRNEAPMLESCGRILQGPMSPELRPFLVEALFDYQSEWYRTKPPLPPPPARMDARARERLRVIGEHALQYVSLDELQRSKVQLTLERL